MKLNPEQALMEELFDPEHLRRLREEMDPRMPRLIDPDTLPTDYRCPYCGYEWSGSPKPPRPGDGR